MFLQEYEKLRLIGKGAFASVYKVRHLEFEYIRALKVSQEEIENKNDKAWRTFLEECKMLLRIGNGAHPNIVRIYQPRLLDGKAAVEMDFVDGLSLSEYISQEKFISIDECKLFATQIVGALAYCHADIYRFLMEAEADNLEPDPTDGRKFIISPDKERELIDKYSVIHNDLHSNNIMRRYYDGQYVLLDFGLSIQDNHCVKSSSRGDGAIEYTAPEKLESNQVSKQSDVYALGILLYEMLAGRVPFQCKGNTPESARAKVYMQHLNDAPPELVALRKEAFEITHPGTTYVDDLPEGLVEIVMKCLEKQPEKRFKDAKELQIELQKCFAKMTEPEVSHSVDNQDAQRDQSKLTSTSTLLEETMELLRSDINQLGNEIREMSKTLEQKISEVSATTDPTTGLAEPPHVPKKKRKTFLQNLLWLIVFFITVLLSMPGFASGWDWYRDSYEVWSYVGNIGILPFLTAILCVIIPWLAVPKWKFINMVLIIMWGSSAGLCCTMVDQGYFMIELAGILLGLVLLISLHKLQYTKQS